MKLLNQFKKIFLYRVRGKYLGQLEIVCCRFLEQVVSCGGLFFGVGFFEEQIIIWFQFYGYLQKQCVFDLEKYFIQFIKEVIFIEEFYCVGQVKVVWKLQGKWLVQFQFLFQILRVWVLFQLDGILRVFRVVSVCLVGVVGNRSFWEKVVFFYINVLVENDVRFQQVVCLVFKQFKGIESIDQIVSLCQFDLEVVWVVVWEIIFLFGEKGWLVFEKMDKFCLE